MVVLCDPCFVTGPNVAQHAGCTVLQSLPLLAQARYHSFKLVGDPNPKSDDCLADIVQDDSDDALGAPSGADIFDAIRIMRVSERG